MAQIVLNPTDEKLEYLYIGILVTINPGEKKSFDDHQAKHLLTNLGPRGLMALNYGDEPREVEIAKQGRELNRKFRQKQVVDFNQSNEMRKQSNLPYAQPPKHIVEYAKGLGIGLYQPYIVKDDEHREISDLRQDVRDRDKKIDKLLNTVEELMDVVKKSETEIPAEKTDAEEVIISTRKRYVSLRGEKLKLFVDNRKADVMAFPETNLRELQDLWKKEFPEEKFPY